MLEFGLRIYNSFLTVTSKADHFFTQQILGQDKERGWHSLVLLWSDGDHGSAKGLTYCEAFLMFLYTSNWMSPFPLNSQGRSARSL